jgi:DNA-binding NarL/FixJ family response regulator
MKQIRAFIVEHRPVCRYGLQKLLASTEDITAVGESDSGEGALLALATCAADVVLLDIDVDGEDGASVIRRLTEAAPGAKVLVATAQRAPERHRQALLAGARGVITEDKPGEVVLRAIRKVHDGELWFERHLLERTVSRSISPERRHAALTGREREIVALIAEGLKNREIARRLHITAKTVRNHLTSIFSKIGVTDRLALLVHASQLGLVRIGAEAR